MILDGNRVIWIFKGQRTRGEFAEEYAVTPDVYLEGVAFVLAPKDFGGGVANGAAVGEGAEVVVAVELLGKAEVDEEDVACLVDDAVFGLQVPVNDLLGVQVFESKEHFHSVELDPPSVQLALLTQLQVLLVVYHPVHVLARLVLEQEADRIFVCERLPQLDHERAVRALLQHLLLVFRVLNSLV